MLSHSVTFKNFIDNPTSFVPKNLTLLTVLYFALSSFARFSVGKCAKLGESKYRFCRYEKCLKIDTTSHLVLKVRFSQRKAYFCTIELKFLQHRMISSKTRVLGWWKCLSPKKWGITIYTTLIQVLCKCFWKPWFLGTPQNDLNKTWIWEVSLSLLNRTFSLKIKNFFCGIVFNLVIAVLREAYLYTSTYHHFISYFSNLLQILRLGWLNDS